MITTLHRTRCIKRYYNRQIPHQYFNIVQYLTNIWSFRIPKDYAQNFPNVVQIESQDLWEQFKN